MHSTPEHTWVQVLTLQYSCVNLSKSCTSPPGPPPPRFPLLWSQDCSCKNDRNNSDTVKKQFLHKVAAPRLTCSECSKEVVFIPTRLEDLGGGWWEMVRASLRGAWNVVFPHAHRLGALRSSEGGGARF